jgi:hypothetical protein
LTLASPLAGASKDPLMTVSVRDRQGNITQVERTLSVKEMP